MAPSSSKVTYRLSTGGKTHRPVSNWPNFCDIILLISNLLIADLVNSSHRTHPVFYKCFSRSGGIGTYSYLYTRLMFFSAKFFLSSINIHSYSITFVVNLSTIPSIRSKSLIASKYCSLNDFSSARNFFKLNCSSSWKAFFNFSLSSFVWSSNSKSLFWIYAFSWFASIRRSALSWSK